MNLIFTIYSVLFLATALVSFFVAFLAWKRRTVNGARELAFLMIAAGIGAFWLIFETAAPSIPDKIFWSKLEYIGGIPTPVLYLIFVLRFTGKNKFLSGKYILLLFTVPFITLALTLTNEQHSLIWSGFSAISEKTNLMEYYHGIGFWIGYIAYTYLMLILATINLLYFIIRQNKTFRSQGLIVLIAGFCPWIASIIYLTGNNPVTGLDITPVSIILSGVLSAYAILNIRFLDLVPVARDTLVETLTDGILVLDGQNRIQDINGAALSFLGIRNKKIIGFLAQSAGASVAQLLNAVIDHETDDHTVEIRSNNELKTFRIFKHEIKKQTGSRLIVLRDITDQVTWQREILAGEERYRHMFSMFRLMADNTEDFLWAKDRYNKYTFVNKTMCDRLLLAKNVNEPIGKTDVHFADRERKIHPGNHDWHTFGEICKDTDTLTLAEGKPQQFDEFGNVQGKFLFLDVHKAPIRDEQGNLIGIVGTGRDVTLTKQLENEKSNALESLRESEEHLQKVIAEKDKFFSIIAHDLRGPFSGFLGLTEIMTEDLPNLTMAEIKEYSMMMKNSATTLLRLLENLLQWARIQQGLIPFNPEVLPLQVIANECISMLFESARKKEIEITISITDGLEVFADINILQLIIRNLVSNALKFTPRGGKVNLFAKAIAENSVEISIEDTGIGMSQSIIDNLFRLDVKTNRTGTEDEPSSGLGLMLCKDFIEKHGGKIRIESEVKRGSVVHFTIPAHSKPE